VQFLLIDHAHEILGASLIWLHTVLDGCDGEMARLTFRESRLGAVLDFWGDNAVHVALFTCMALDVAHDYPSALVFGALAGLGTLGSAWLAFKSRPETPPEAGRTRVGSLLRNMEVALAQRDFIYLLVLAAIFDRAEWFMWAAGIGTPLYLAGMIYLRLQASSRRAAGRKADLAPLEANELKSGLGV